MKQEDLQKTLEVLSKGGIHVAGDFVVSKHVEYEVNNVEAGGIGIQINNEKCSPMVTNTEEDVKSAIEKLMEARDENGTYIMRDQDQWYAVFRVLSAKCGFPQKSKDFVVTMANLGLDNLRVPCRYESIRKVSFHNLPQNVDLWHQYQNTADQYSMKQVTVAVRLMELMG